MKMNLIKITGVALALAATFSSCTKKFEELNTNPYGATDDQLAADYALVPAQLQTAQKSIYVFAPAWVTQLQQNLLGDVYSGYMMPPTPFAGNSNNMTLNMVDGWNTWAFNPGYSSGFGSVMDPLTKAEKTTKTAAPEVYAMSKIVKVEAMHRVSDMFGPIIYSKYTIPSSDGSYDYDNQKDVYYNFFADLKEAIDILTPKASAAPTSIFKACDLAFAGDYRKWLRLANTLRLRLAVRVSKVDPSKAKLEGEAALANTGGLLQPGDDFKIDIGTTIHPLNVINNAWGDIRMGAPAESVLGGYSDPRLPKYYQPATDAAVAGQYKGIRQGINIDAKSRYEGYSALTTFASNLLLVTAAEAFFLKAEAAIRGWAGAGDAKTAYEAGVQASFTQYGLGSATTYLANSTSKPKEYKDPKAVTPGQNDVLTGSANLSTITIKWDDAATFEQKLERIITQKWIAMYPDGQEAWSEVRRTGYPKIFPVIVNNSGGKIPTAIGCRRVPFPSSEYATNKAAVERAVTALGGPDNGGTRLWWDKP